MAIGKVLVVDDELQYVDVVAFKFRNAGWQVVTASDGQEGLDRATAELPDIVISDYQMPVVDGLALCKHLRANSQTHSTPFILLTAHGLDIDDEMIEQAGITLVMSKPFSPRELLARATDLRKQHQPCAG